MRLIHAGGAIALGLVAAPALAQDAGSDGGSDGYVLTIGAGGYFEPAFPGADKMKLKPWPIFGLRKQGTEERLETPDEGFGFSLIGGDSPVRIGPSIRFESGRKRNDVPGLGKVGFTVEAGGFAEVWAGDNFRLRGELRQAVNGHDGLVGDVMADLVGKPDPNLELSVGPRLRWADRKYHRAFFGVDAAQSLATGFVPYAPGSGIVSVGGLAYAKYRMAPRWQLHAYGSYNRLTSDAADSPIVRSSFGSRDQFGVGLGVSYDLDINF